MSHLASQAPRARGQGALHSRVPTTDYLRDPGALIWSAIGFGIRRTFEELHEGNSTDSDCPRRRIHVVFAKKIVCQAWRNKPDLSVVVSRSQLPFILAAL